MFAFAACGLALIYNIGALSRQPRLVTQRIRDDIVHHADRIGVELAARAGFDPRAAIMLWQKMAQASASRTPGFLSTHPAAADRIADLQQYAAQVMPIYQSTQRR